MVDDSFSGGLGKEAHVPGHTPSRFPTPVLVEGKHGTRSGDSCAARTAGQSPGLSIATYETFVSEYVGIDCALGGAALSAYAELNGRVELRSFAEVAAGRTAAWLKSDYLKQFGIPTRMFNAMRVLPEAKIASVREQRELQLDSLQRRIARAQLQNSNVAEQGRGDQVHQKLRRLATLQSRRAYLEADIEQGRGPTVLRVQAPVAQVAHP